MKWLQKISTSLLFPLLFLSCQKEISQDSEFDTLGNSAKQLLSSSPFATLYIDINYMPGHEPDATTLTNLSDFLKNHINKPGGIFVRKNAVAGSGKTQLSLSELVKLEKAHRTTYTYGDVMAVHILITDTDYKEEDIFAVSYWNTSFCLFGKTIAENSGGPGQVGRQQLYTTLLQHEFGHLMGLVDQGSPMQQLHRDSGNGAHCTNTSCLMYYGIETDAGRAGTVPVLDAACRADLKANGGK
jgi:hypothetical protein